MSSRGSAAAAFITVPNRPQRSVVQKKSYSPSPIRRSTRSRTSKSKPSLPLYDPHPDRRSPPLPRRTKTNSQTLPPESESCSSPQPSWICACNNEDCMHITCPCGLPNSPLIESSAIQQDWICCENSCYQCFHRECVGLSKKQYKALTSALGKSYVCHSCQHKDAVKLLPSKIREHYAECITQSPQVPVVAEKAVYISPPRSTSQSSNPPSPPNLWLSDSTDDPPTVKRPSPPSPTPTLAPESFLAPNTPISETFFAPDTPCAPCAAQRAQPSWRPTRARAP